MHHWRISLASLMGLVVFAAVGLVGLREGTPFWGQSLYWLALLAVLGASIHGVLSDGATRAGRIGFALFGGVYLVLAANGQPSLPHPLAPMTSALMLLHNRIHLGGPIEMITSSNVRVWTISGGSLSTSTNGGFTTIYPRPNSFFAGGSAGSRNFESYAQAGHSIFAVLFGLFGAVWARMAWIRATRPRDADVALSSEPPTGAAG